MYTSPLFADRHILDLLAQCPPIVRLQLRILDELLAPVLMKLANMVLRLLEEDQLVPDALFDEYAPSMLVDDGLLVLI